jgi:hypothetical protein
LGCLLHSLQDFSIHIKKSELRRLEVELTPQSHASSSSSSETGVPPNRYGLNTCIKVTQKKAVLVPTTLSECLAPHDQCTSEYHDFTGKFRLRCVCSCHNKQNSLSTKISDMTNVYPAEEKMEHV